MLKKELERKRFRIKDENGNITGDITAISVVSEPAIGKKFQLFNALPIEKINFKVTDNEKMEITGPVMIPNLNILRQDQETNEYYNCYFTEEDVKDYSEVYLKECNHTQANFEHTESFTKDLFICESWIVIDPLKDKSRALGFKDVTKGTWFCTYKTYNKELWEQIKASDFTGFSVEIELNKYQQLEIELNEIIDDYFFTKQEKLNAVKQIVNFYSLEIGELSFGDYPANAVDNAKRALEYKANNPESSCGNKMLWKRCNQIANKQPLSYSNMKRIAMNIKHESNANASNYDTGCNKILWDAFGGTELVYWSINKLQQIDLLVKKESEILEQEKRKRLYGIK